VDPTRLDRHESTGLPPGQCVDIIFDADVGRTRIYDNLVVGERHSRTRKNPENLCATTTDNDWGLTSR
jgi:hypothetical protein